MSEYEYDSHGLPTSYFAITFLIISIGYMFIKIKQSNSISNVCKVEKCNCVYKSSYKSYYGILTVLILSLSALLKYVYKVKMESLYEGYNPYKVLDVPEDSEFADIKKTYKKMFRKLSRQKNRIEPNDENKTALEGIEERLIAINQAFEFIETPKYYEDWILNQTRRELLIAIPKNIFNIPFVIIILIFCLILLKIKVLHFFLVNRSSKSYNNICFSTFETFYENIYRIDNKMFVVILQEILILLSETEDIKEIDASIDPVKIKQCLKTKYSEVMVRDTREFAMIVDYLFKTNLCSEEVHKKIQEKSIKILDGYLKITLDIRPELFLTLTSIKRMLMQDIYSANAILLQFPFTSFEDSKKYLNMSKLSPETILDALNEIPLKKVEKMLAMKVFDMIPQFVIKDLKCYSLTDSYLTLKDNQYLFDSSYNTYLEFNVDCLNGKTCFDHIHAPFLQEKVSYSVLYSINGHVQPSVKKGYLNSDRFVFLLPKNINNSYKVKVLLLLDGYLGFDTEESIKITHSSDIINVE